MHLSIRAKGCSRAAADAISHFDAWKLELPLKERTLTAIVNYEVNSWDRGCCSGILVSLFYFADSPVECGRRRNPTVILLRKAEFVRKIPSGLRLRE